MVAIAFTAQNCALTMGTVAYGAALATVQKDFGIERATASMGSALMLLAMGLLSPVAGNLLQRISIRNAMTTGAIMSALGYAIVATATNFNVVLVSFALLIGPGACLLGPVSIATLISRWFDKDRGKALGLANMPLFMLFVPSLVAFLILEGGRQALFLTMAAIFAVLVPMVRLVRERPDHPPERANGSQDDGKTVEVAEARSNGELLRDGRFWLLNLGMGVLAGSGSAFVTHAVPLATSKGIDFALAASVLSVFGMGTLAGSIFFGWLIDRIGALPSLVLAATILALVWIGLWVFDDLRGVLCVAAVMGATLGSINALHAASIAFLFGAPSVSRAMGLAYFLKMPFLFVWTPLLGYLFDRYGDYSVALLTTAGAIGSAAGAFLLLALLVRRRRIDAGNAQARGATLR